MQPERLMTTPVTISTPGASTGTDILGRPIPGTATVRATRCRLVRTATDTPDPNTDGLLVSTLAVYVPTGTGLTDADTLTVDGETYQVLGAPEILAGVNGGGYEKATVRLVQDAS